MVNWFYLFIYSILQVWPLVLLHVWCWKFSPYFNQWWKKRTIRSIWKVFRIFINNLNKGNWFCYNNFQNSGIVWLRVLFSGYRYKKNTLTNRFQKFWLITFETFLKILPFSFYLSINFVRSRKYSLRTFRATQVNLLIYSSSGCQA